MKRYYEPALGSYPSYDPLGLAPAADDTSYVDNPLTAIDPLGLDQGDNIGLSREQRVAQLIGGTVAKQLVTFDWWLTSDEDIVCSAGPVPSDDRLQELWFYLDGVDQDVRERVAAALLDLVRSKPEDTTGLVVDYRGRTVEFEIGRATDRPGTVAHPSVTRAVS